jgi:hypothetical protein
MLRCVIYSRQRNREGRERRVHVDAIMQKPSCICHHARTDLVYKI